MAAAAAPLRQQSGTKQATPTAQPARPVAVRTNSVYLTPSAAARLAGFGAASDKRCSLTVKPPTRARVLRRLLLRACQVLTVVGGRSRTFNACRALSVAVAGQRVEVSTDPGRDKRKSRFPN